jgi:hypothetical protein
MTGTFLGASLGPWFGVCPSRLSAGAARRSEWSGLAVDVLVDVRRWCACAGDGEIGRGPEVFAHVGADTAAGVFGAHRAGGTAFEPLRERRDGRGGRVVHEQVHVVGFAVELDSIDVEFNAQGADGVFAEGEYFVGEHRRPVFGHEVRVGVVQGHAVPGAAMGLGCRCVPLRLRCADG